MKTINLFFLAMLITGSAFAQLQPGTRFSGIGIGIGIGFKKPDEGSKTFSYEARSSAGSFVADNLVVGLSMGYYRAIQRLKQTESPPDYSSHYRSENETITRIYNLGPMARYYYSLGNRFALFAEGTAGLQTAKVKTESYFSGAGHPDGSWDPATGGESVYKSETNEVSLYAMVSPGLVYFPTDKIGIELKANLLRYQHGFGRGHYTDLDFDLSRTNLGVGFYF
ncbi:outer membrane beta-barrel protein [Pontibacter ramchanderi]|uniref:Outer membrane protein with beta-barrel domain n=1 Tax=Pontibacter ramchanderi TaxID=1179743 RepID=A0A2N3U8S8_9BACT|nr:outer membrane beta-barrel protein [Pontibacter ramchanderi]PKV63160.1 outer membrane protein with beta-barrel domain [Pontibacter ramchanderi]